MTIQKSQGALHMHYTWVSLQSGGYKMCSYSMSKALKAVLTDLNGQNTTFVLLRMFWNHTYN